GRRLVRHRRMEGGVEDGDVWRVGQRRTSGLDRLQRRLIVERSEWTQLLDRSNHVAVDQRRLDEAFTAVHDAVADGIRGGVLVNGKRHPTFDEGALEARGGPVGGGGV